MTSGALFDNGRVRLRACRHGVLLYPVHDIYIGRSLDHYGEYSESEVQLLRQLIRPGQTVVEVGAHIGALTIPLAAAVGAKGWVVALEPQRYLYHILCANIVLSDWQNVLTYWAAAGEEPGRASLPQLNYAQPHNFGGLSLEPLLDAVIPHGGSPGGTHGQATPADERKVTVLTVDELQLRTCHLLKIDVEGMERAVLVGAGETIQRCRPALYVENDRPEKSAELIETIQRLGYRLYWHCAPLFNAHNYARAADNIFGGLVSVNMLCLPASSPQNVRGLREIRSPEDDWRA